MPWWWKSRRSGPKTRWKRSRLRPTPLRKGSGRRRRRPRHPFHDRRAQGRRRQLTVRRAVQLRGISPRPGVVPPVREPGVLYQAARVWGIMWCARHLLGGGRYALETGDRAALNDLVVRGVGTPRPSVVRGGRLAHPVGCETPSRTSGPPREFFRSVSGALGTRTMSSADATGPTAARAGPTSRPMPRRSFPSSRANDPDAVIVVGTPTW